MEAVGWLITVGDELLLGDILNGNAHHIAFELRSKGFRLGRMTTVGDREDEIIQMLLESMGKCQFLIITGGLGPTEDDRTSAAVSKAFGRNLVPSPEYTMWLQKHLAKHGRSWTDELERMARLPQGSVKLGMDMAGYALEHQGVPCYFLPGVPHEMKSLLEQAVIPDLEKRFPAHLQYVKYFLRVQGLVESEISRRLRGLSLDETGVAIGYLPQGPEIWLTLFAAGADKEETRMNIRRAEGEIISRLGALHVSGRDDESIEVVVGRQLKERAWRIATAESCTGGLVAKRITSVAGASDYFDRGFITYSNDAKMELLGVSEEVLKLHGAVSEPAVLAMAEGARDRAKVDVALAVTGIAGPTGGSPEKPVGMVFIGSATAQGHAVENHLFDGDRGRIQKAAAHAALVHLWRRLLT